MVLRIDTERDYNLMKNSWRTALSFRNKPSALVRNIVEQSPDKRYFFWGCGKGRNMVVAPDRTNIIGYDLNLEHLLEHIPDDLKDNVIDETDLEVLTSYKWDFVFLIQVLQTIPSPMQYQLLAQMAELLTDAETVVFEVRSKIQLRSNRERYDKGWISNTFRDGSETYQELIDLGVLRKIVFDSFSAKDYPYQKVYRATSSLALIISKSEINLNI